MPLAPGTRLGPYEVVAPLGAGGMGEVYRARDVRLDRVVALKVLPVHLAGDPLLKDRFEREAKAISQLNHPNICTLHDVGSDHGIDFLVMEYLEGETLAERLTSGALAVGPTLQIAKQVAEALDRAHAAGIVHRDLKPSNVFLVRAAGTSAAPIVKLLDFGLAKSLTSLVSPNTAQPTLAQALTGQGTIIGTLQYMAPEQLEGRDVDARADVFAFAAVLYEMLTGKRPFEGRSQASIIASILSAEPPPVSSLQPVTPPALDHLIGRGLAKDPVDRWSSMHDVLLQLRWIATLPASAAAAPAAARSVARDRVWWIAAVAVLAVALAAAVWNPRPVPAPPRLHFQIQPPPETTFLASGFGTVYMTPTVSHDGASVIVPAIGADGIRRLWLQRLDSGDLQLLNGTDNGSLPFWSPDDHAIGFFAAGKLLRLDLPGGMPRVIADAPSGLGGSWSRDGAIVFAGGVDGPLQRVPASGGVPSTVTTLDASRQEVSHRFPDFLADGRRFLFLARSASAEASALLLGSLDSSEVSRVMPSALGAMFVPPRWIAYPGQTIGSGGTLIASLLVRAFDPATARVSGEPITLQDSVVVSDAGAGAYSFSHQGVFAYRTPVANRSESLNWYTRAGVFESTVGSPGDYTVPRLSPDGRRLAIAIGGSIWVRDLIRGTASRVTSGPADCCPIWSPDGTRIGFRHGVQDLGFISASGTGSVTVVLQNGAPNTPTQWTPDGAAIIFQTTGRNRVDSMLLPLAEPRTAKPLQQSAFNDEQAQVSPDGQWIAFTSDESGRPEVYVQDYPALKEKFPVSTDGGADPQWRRDGAELFFLAADHKLMAAAIKRGPTFEAGIPTALFQTRVTGLTDVRTHYQVTADGQRFLVNTISPGDRGAPIHVVANWQTGVTR
jgi:eukaryotic-like serine/threonine-protein kinase